MTPYVGRLAPSPTGALHLGNVRTFMVAWLRARSLGGKVILRTEDLDHPKDKPGAAAQAIEDLKWLGFDWDEAFVQSERKAIYREARDILLEQRLLYPCVCSRRDVEHAQSAPHAGEQLFYPGTCRDRFASWQDAVDYLHLHLSPSPSPCWRFRVPEDSRVAFDDAFAGRVEQDVAATLGDFPVSRDEGGAGYTLAVVVDDLLMGVTEVVRGDDLLAATPAQILIARALRNLQPSTFNLQPPTFNLQPPTFNLQPPTSNLQPSTFNLQPSTSNLQPPTSNLQPPTFNLQPSTFNLQPSYCHIPLVVGPDGRRLAKRHGDTRIASFREQGVKPEALLGFLAASCGWAEKGERVSLPDVLSRFSLATIPHAPFVVARMV